MQEISLDIDIQRIDQELAQLLIERSRLDARIEGRQAERQALVRLTAPDAAGENSASITSMTKDRAIVAVLRNASSPLRIQDIVDAMALAGRPDETYNAISVYLDTLLRQRRVVRVSRGLYVATDGDQHEATAS